MKKDSTPRYKAICPCCGTELWVCKSMAMEMGMSDMGSGSCFNCNKFLHLEFDKENQIMKATPWDDYMKTREKPIKDLGQEEKNENIF